MSGHCHQRQKEVSTTDRTDFEKIYERTKESTHRYIAAKCFDLGDIDDIFQTAYLAVYEAVIRRSEPIPNEEAFVMLITKRTLTRYYSLAAKLRNLLPSGRAPALPADIPDSIDVEEELITRELISEIGSRLSRKPLITRKIFYLYYSREITLAEIAALLGMKETTVKKYLYSTLAEIRRFYERRDRS